MNRPMNKLLIVAFGLGVIYGCSKEQHYRAPDFRKIEIGKTPSFDPHKEDSIAEYKKMVEKIIDEKLLILGMTKEMVVKGRGKPERINRTVSRWGVSEQWVYGSLYLYFEDGVLTSYQD
jgi:hypothetical protein